MKIELEDASRFDEVCGILRSGDQLCLEPGKVFITRGAWAFPQRSYRTIPDGVELIATGAEVCFAADPETRTGGVTRAARDLALMFIGHDTKIVGGLFNATAPNDWYSSGVRAFGRSEISGATFKGGNGSRKFGTESFLLSSEGPAGGSAWRNNKFDNVCQTSDAYVTACYPGATVSTDAPATIVANCEVVLGTYGQAAYSASGHPTVFADCSASAPRLFYVDTGDAPYVELLRLTGIASYAAISIVGTTACNRQVRAQDCKFQAPRLVEWWDTTSRADAMTGIVNVQRGIFTGEFLACVTAKCGLVVLDYVATSAKSMALHPDAPAPIVWK